MNSTGYILFFLTICFLCSSFYVNFNKGITLAFGLIVALPSYMSISFPGPLPELTIHRVILLIVLIYYIRENPARQIYSDMPLLIPISILVLIHLLSMLSSITPTVSLKHFISLNLETVLFYIMLSNSLVSNDMSLRLIKSGCMGLTVVAALAAAEKYAHINITQLLTGVHLSVDPLRPMAIHSTYPHRILLGYAMAMGFALQFFLTAQQTTITYRMMTWISLILFCSGCYFADSRGAWIGLLIAVSVIGLFGSQKARRTLLILGFIGLTVIISRPGVRQAIMNRYDATVSTDTVEGHSYRYRWLLWGVAWSEINRSPWRLLVGYGGLSTESMDLSHYFPPRVGGSTAKLGYTSWDNQFAANMVEFGLLGFMVEAIVYINALWRLAKGWMQAREGEKELYTAIIGAVAIYLFAMTNVYMFSDQLRFLLWGLLAIGCKLGTPQHEVLNKIELLFAMRLAFTHRQPSPLR